MKPPSHRHHGGKRAGAGRPARLEKPKAITVYLDAATVATLEAIDPNLSKAIRTLAARSKE
jgi:hypothetical protein